MKNFRDFTSRVSDVTKNAFDKASEAVQQHTHTHANTHTHGDMNMNAISQMQNEKVEVQTETKKSGIDASLSDVPREKLETVVKQCYKRNKELACEVGELQLQVDKLNSEKKSDFESREMITASQREMIRELEAEVENVQIKLKEAMKQKHIQVPSQESCNQTDEIEVASEDDIEYEDIQGLNVDQLQRDVKALACVIRRVQNDTVSIHEVIGDVEMLHTHMADTHTHTHTHTHRDVPVCADTATQTVPVSVCEELPTHTHTHTDTHTHTPHTHTEIHTHTFETMCMEYEEQYAALVEKHKLGNEEKERLKTQVCEYESTHTHMNSKIVRFKELLSRANDLIRQKDETVATVQGENNRLKASLADAPPPKAAICVSDVRAAGGFSVCVDVDEDKWCCLCTHTDTNGDTHTLTHTHTQNALKEVEWFRVEDLEEELKCFVPMSLQHTISTETARLQRDLSSKMSECNELTQAHTLLSHNFESYKIRANAALSDSIKNLNAVNLQNTQIETLRNNLQAGEAKFVSVMEERKTMAQRISQLELQLSEEMQARHRSETEIAAQKISFAKKNRRIGFRTQE